MKQVTAAAPGKLVIFGEYAVVHGAPAIVAAIDRFATATIRPRAGCNRVIAPDVMDRPAELTIADHQLHWADAVDANAIALVDAALRELACHDALPSEPGFELTLSTEQFSAGPEKLGLGSSAALSVAIVRAFLGWTNQRGLDPVELAKHAHQRFQSGQGSGVDIAASSHGGVLGFWRDSQRLDHYAWPKGLGWRCIWTGRGASTTVLLDAVAALRQHDPGHWQALIARLSQLAESGQKAFAKGDSKQFTQLVSSYHRAMADLGSAAGVPIVDARHQRLAELAEHYGVAYKPSGAGGGDMGLAFGKAPHLARFQSAAELANFDCLELALVPASIEPEKTLK